MKRLSYLPALLIGVLLATSVASPPALLAAESSAAVEQCDPGFRPETGFTGSPIQLAEAQEAEKCATFTVADNQVAVIGAGTMSVEMEGRGVVYNTPESLIVLFGPARYTVRYTWGAVRLLSAGAGRCEFAGWKAAEKNFKNFLAPPDWLNSPACAETAPSVDEPMPTDLQAFALPARETWNEAPSLGNPLFAFSTDEPSAVSHTLHVRGELRRGEVLITMAGRIASVPGKEGVIRVVWGPVIYDDSAQNALFYGTTVCLAHDEVVRLAKESNITNIEPFPSRTELCGE